jgi:hypothetical protein
MNKLSRQSVDVVQAYQASAFNNAQQYIGRPPFYKYPLMRAMFHERPIETPYTLWFDDDSWIKTSAPDDWFERLEQHMHTKQLHVAGARYWIHLRGNQHLWIADQPWYTGKPVSPRMKVDFITGGWLALRTHLIYKYDWPSSDIVHNGGDVMLGALCHQQDLTIGNFTEHLAINADQQTAKCSSANRRGASLTPAGVDYKRPEERPINEVADNEWMRLFDGRNI